MTRERFLTPEFLDELLGNGIIVPRPKSKTTPEDDSWPSEESLLTPEAVEDMRQRMNEQFGAKPQETDD